MTRRDRKGIPSGHRERGSIEGLPACMLIASRSPRLLRARNDHPPHAAPRFSWRVVGVVTLKITLTVLSACLLQACSITLTVRGQVQNSPEAFAGTATGYLSGSDNLRMVSTKGTVCDGDFVYINDRQGECVFTCEDGRSGPFQFVSTGKRGTGYGGLGGQRFTFNFVS